MMYIAVNILSTISLMLVTQGLPQTCYYYCKNLTNQSPNLRRECNCTAYQQDLSNKHGPYPNNKISRNIHEHLKLNSAYSELSEKHFHLSNTDHHKTTRNRNVSSDVRSNNDSSQKSLGKNTNSSKPIGEFPLYLDIDLHKPLNNQGLKTNFKMELKHIFDKVRASNNNMSECNDLYVYIFSKNNNVDRTHTHWGHHIKHDNIPSSEVLTEILNKCDHLNTIVRESVFEVTQRESDNDKTPSSLPNHETERTNTELANNFLEPANLANKGKIENSDNTYPSNVSDLKSGRHLSRSQSNIVTVSKEPSVSLDEFQRGVHVEEDILLTKIITIEHANNTVTSVLDGFEEIPNLDFISFDSNSITAINAMRQADSITANPSATHQSDLTQDRTGDLNIVLGNNSIPARFIQNSEGEMHLAVDAFSLCDLIGEGEEEKTIFIKLLCDSIKLHNFSR